MSLRWKSMTYIKTIRSIYKTRSTTHIRQVLAGGVGTCPSLTLWRSVKCHMCRARCGLSCAPEKTHISHDLIHALTKQTSMMNIMWTKPLEAWPRSESQALRHRAARPESEALLPHSQSAPPLAPPCGLSWNSTPGPSVHRRPRHTLKPQGSNPKEFVFYFGTHEWSYYLRHALRH